LRASLDDFRPFGEVLRKFLLVADYKCWKVPPELSAWLV
jgi:hypothetical protein